MAAGELSTPPLGFTAKWIAALRPGPAREECSDRGLVLRLLPSGRKVFVWYAWAEGRQRRTVVTIGTWALSEGPGRFTLMQARTWLERLKAAREGGALAEVMLEMRRALHGGAPAPPGHTVGELAEEWYRRAILGTRRRPEEVRRTLDTDILPRLGELLAPAVTPADCREVVTKVVDRGAASHAGKVLDHMRQLFAWAEGFGEEIRKNPAAVLSKDALGVRTKKGKRVLAPAEIPLFWRGLDAHRPGVRRLSDAVRLALRLLLLTGARTGELLKARWTEVDLEAATWTVPVENQKLNPKQVPDARPWVVPLSPAALELFQELKRSAGRSPWVVASSESKSGRVTDKALSHALRGLFDAELLALPGGRATPHDLRRTMRTKLGELGVAPHVAERCLNHSLGRMATTYDLGDYAKERRAALELWSAYVANLLAPEEGKVAFLRGVS